jgi:hypothetical protein
MKELVFFYILGCLISCSWICTWFFSDLPVRLFKSFGLIKKEEDIFTWDDWSQWILLKSDFFGELLSCPLCFGFWTSLTVSSVIFYINGLNPYFILSSAFSWPLFIYYSYNHFQKN